MKETIKKFREEIAELEKKQKELKPQRKTVHFKGERTLDPFSAWCEVKGNKEELRAMYAAYGLLRGKPFSYTEKAAKPLNSAEFYIRYGQPLDKELEGKHPLYTYCSLINDYLEKYGYSLTYETKEEKDYWGNTRVRKIFKPEDCEKIVRIGEQKA